MYCVFWQFVMTESHSKVLADMLESHAVHDFCLVGPKVSITTPICDVSLLLLLCQTSSDNFAVGFCYSCHSIMGVRFLVDLKKAGENRYNVFQHSR